MSTRNRSGPWFRAPGARYERAVADHERSRQRSGTVEPEGGTFQIVRVLLTRYCEQCGARGEDVQERAGSQCVNGVLYVNGVLRLRAVLCGRCARLLPQ